MSKAKLIDTRIQVGQLKALDQVANAPIRPLLTEFWDFEEYVVHMLYSARREHECIAKRKVDLAEIAATMIWEEIPGRSGTFVGHFRVAQPELVSQCLGVGDLFTAIVDTNETRAPTWKCTCGPPLYTDEDYQVSAVLVASPGDVDYHAAARFEWTAPQSAACLVLCYHGHVQTYT